MKIFSTCLLMTAPWVARALMASSSSNCNNNLVKKCILVSFIQNAIGHARYDNNGIQLAICQTLNKRYLKLVFASILSKPQQICI